MPQTPPEVLLSASDVIEAEIAKDRALAAAEAKLAQELSDWSDTITSVKVEAAKVLPQEKLDGGGYFVGVEEITKMLVAEVQRLTERLAESRKDTHHARQSYDKASGSRDEIAAECERLIALNSALERELDRHSHGEQIESNYICSHAMENIRLREANRELVEGLADSISGIPCYCRNLSMVATRDVDDTTCHVCKARELIAKHQTKEIP